MWWWYVLFLFVAFGSKLVLALATIWFLLPEERDCAGCGGETVAVRMGGFGRTVRRLMLGRIERRWCPGCGWEGTSRIPKERRTPLTIRVAGPPPGARRRV